MKLNVDFKKETPGNKSINHYFNNGVYAPKKIFETMQCYSTKNSSLTFQDSGQIVNKLLDLKS